MERLALYLLWGGLVASAMAAATYVFYALQPLVTLALPRRSLVASAGAAGSVTLSEGPRRPSTRSRTLGGVATFGAWTAVLAGGLGLTLRAIHFDHAPFSNLFEFSMAFGSAIALVYVLFERRFHTRLLGAFVMPVSFGLYASALAFPSEGHATLVPALQNPTLLTIHVSMMILSYAVLTVAFGAAAMQILQGDRVRRHAWLPAGDRCDELTYRAVLVGFPMLAAGIALGALWADSAWGRYWGWDPKETSALVTWLIFAVYLHTRGVRKLQGVRGAWIVVLGFVAVLFTYLGVNLWISGLHSYAGV